MLDLIIIGGSAAGVSAAVYAARRSLNFLLISGDIGGEVATSGEIENYLGFNHTDGITMMEQFTAQLQYNHVPIEQPVHVERVEPVRGGFRVAGKHVSKAMSWEAKAVIIATGIHPRPLPVPQEAHFRGKGVTYCTTCDGPLYRGKTVATIGGGNSALESALFLAAICPKVYLINKNPRFKGESVLVEKVEANEKIEIIPSVMTKELVGDTQVRGLRYEDAQGTMHDLAVDGVFVHIGQIPNSDLVPKNVTLTKFKEIVVDKECRTNLPGLFAAGDVTDVPFKQIAIASGQGVTAALTAVSYLNTLKD